MSSDQVPEDSADHISDSEEESFDPTKPFDPMDCFKGLPTYPFTSIEDMQEIVARSYDEDMSASATGESMRCYVVFKDVPPEMAETIMSQRGLFGEDARFDLWVGSLERVRIKLLPPILRALIGAVTGVFNSTIAEMGVEEGEVVSSVAPVTATCSCSGEHVGGCDTCSGPESGGQQSGTPGESLPGESNSENGTDSTASVDK
jgi:hypothetical protein